MKLWINRLLPAAALLLAPAVACAHFLFVVPEPGGVSARVVMSETLEPDDDVSADALAGARLVLRDADGAETPLAMHPGDRAFQIALPGDGTRIVRGTAELGVMQRGIGPAHRLVYHAKTILGGPFAEATRLGWDVPVELIPVGGADDVRLKLLADGAAKADAEVTVIFPDGRQEIVKTDANGLTPAMNQVGRYGAWARHWRDAAGEHDGKAYEQIRHYAMLVFDAPQSASGATVAAAPATRPAEFAVTTLPPLPEAAASHGAVAADGWLYVYGGHVAPTHDYHTEAVSGAFHRARLADLKAGGDADWESLPGGLGMQGMNLAALGGKVFRIGGMRPQNAPGSPEDNRSLADAAVYDPTAGAWSPLPLLPEPRSSHDVVALDGKLYVVGGWDMHGGAETWAGDFLVLDPAAESPRWERRPQPFKRRALIAAAHQDKLYVIGGMNDAEQIPNSVDVYDPSSDEWTKGPDLPAGRFNGFSPAAVTLDGRLYVGVADGSLLRLTGDGGAWETVANTTPRVVHRVIPDGDRLLLVGGAAGGENLDLIEGVTIPGTEAETTAVAAQTRCPIMTGRAVDESSYTVLYRGAEVRLCCKTCLKKWNADPEAYARSELLPQLNGAR